MNVLLLGSGGREHALAWKISCSPLLDKLYIAPGNPGTLQYGQNLSLDIMDFQTVGVAALEYGIDLIVVGPEEPLVRGLHDYFLQTDELSRIPVVGPTMSGAQLEGSKDFAKAFMSRHNIPTARYNTFSSRQFDQAVSFIKTLTPPYVLKADGLAAGKGVVILSDLEAAIVELKEMLLKQKFGQASDKVVIEEFLTGIELSVFILTDGHSYLLLPEAKDYKRIGEGDTGPNTGGMGSVSPVPFADEHFLARVKQHVIEPTIQGLQEENIPYRGFIFFGLMNVGGNPFVIEYNCRLGDPETESVLPRIESDLLELLKAAGDGSLDRHTLKISAATAATVMLVSEGYPGSYEKGKEITGLDSISGCFCFHAGTRIGENPGKILTNGGRVLAVTAVGTDQASALSACYSNIAHVKFEGKVFRRDIGFDLCS
jgi:phosphoribosylamine--glycine ligase